MVIRCNYKWILSGVLILVFLLSALSLPKIRILLINPLVSANNQAKGDAAYVLAGGNALQERLLAAADLYQMNRITSIIIMDDTSRSYYNFRTGQSWNRTDWSLDYLGWLGIPKEKIYVFNCKKKSMLGTLNEARIVFDELPDNISELVIITSAPHTRRCQLTFSRISGNSIKIIPYAATRLEDSIEFWQPIWLEYLKLVYYWIVV